MSLTTLNSWNSRIRTSRNRKQQAIPIETRVSKDGKMTRTYEHVRDDNSAFESFRKPHVKNKAKPTGSKGFVVAIVSLVQTSPLFAAARQPLSISDVLCVCFSTKRWMV